MKELIYSKTGAGESSLGFVKKHNKQIKKICSFARLLGLFKNSILWEDKEHRSPPIIPLLL